MNIPNRLTTMRMIAVPIVMALILTEHNILAFILFAAASITDFLDGYIARKKNMVSSFGKIMDPLADKLLTIGVLICFIQTGLISVWAPMIIISREMFVTSLRVVASAKGKVIAASMWGKVKTNVQMFAIMFAILFGGKFELVSSYVLWATAIFTVISWIAYIFENAEVFKD